MKKYILATDDSYAMLLLRVMLGVVMLAHGLQKTFGWFNGFGWGNSMKYFTDTVGLPSVLAVFVILIESLGAFLLIIGFASRINALLMGIVMAGAFIVAHYPNGFYMNWFGTNKGEGYEFDLLFWAIVVAIVMKGSGKFSVDRLLSAG